MFGTVRELADGRVELRFERWYAHPREKVWRALTEPAELRRWFVEILDYDRSALAFAPGAELTFVAEGLPAGQGRVLAFEPPALLEYTWDDETLRWELSAADGGCRLVFTNVVGDGGTAAAVDAGWDLGLKRLSGALDL
ncbi:SRPBCC domain-containing protein [Actinophytocola sp.]|uniref:SRPBCC domain-containing protein n=1 Tax=Actinophytocola sp. TaxID=1872138 RepID=UPI00389A9394